MTRWIRAVGIILALAVALATSAAPVPGSAQGRGTEGQSSLNSPSYFQCPGAPFIIPSGNYLNVPYFYCRGQTECNPGAPYYNHQGIDLKQYENGQPVTTPGIVPVYAAYAGTVILDSRHGNAPRWLDIMHTNVGGQPVVYTFYTHLANASCTESYIVVSNGQRVEQGDLLGYQGNCSGDPARPASVHLHFSVNYPGVSEFDNNQDPSPFLGFNVNGDNGATSGYITPDRCTKSCCCSFSLSASGFTATIVSGESPLLSIPFEPLPILLPTVAPEPFPATMLPSPTPAPVASQQQSVVQVNTTPPTSAHYMLARSVFGTGGGLRTSTHFVMQGTSGQTTGVDWRQSTDYVLRSGYWTWEFAAHHTIYLPIVLRHS